ncbi:uncharacterized protein AB675_5228 [Cyphellophora attinorum]|uniref:Uncharacterized protein n=1 Tax=Cyphellophora attinorum TaxID=1664694 RepID=A0A0N1H315_9EURO|nr:uncharacterized protein AB675_5228 [Phialophora attinorum]KPI39250.1 hypothetical protein AB675_5228 [Phialophora attinorum]
MDEVPLFRAPKRRKVDPTATTRGRTVSPGPETGDGNDDDGPQMLTLRRPARPGKTGVLFTSAKAGPSDRSADMTVMKAAAPEQHLEDIAGRFVGSAGHRIDVDHHMLAYIDSEMAKRRQVQHSSTRLSENESSSESSASASPEHDPAEANVPPPPIAAPSPSVIPSRPQHQLSEVPLPPREPTPPPAPKRTRKPRLDRHGRPMRPRRGPKRRPSEEIARDALVEAVLHEHKLDHYQPGPNTNDKPSSGSGGDVTVKQKADDEAFAAQFQQDFEDRMAERRRRKDPLPQTAAAVKSGGAKAAAAEEQKSSGPRLGGSRNARIKMAKEREKDKVSGT